MSDQKLKFKEETSVKKTRSPPKKRSICGLAKPT